MKKQLFLLSLSLLFVGHIALADDCCPTSCKKKVTVSDCKPCTVDHGKTFRRHENAFQNGAPMYVSMFNTNVVRNLEEEDKHGGFEMTVFGGKNTKQADSACYYFPNGHYTYNVDGTVDPQTFVRALAYSDVNPAGGTEQITVFDMGTTSPSATGPDVNPATFKFDPNKDTSILRPWNFGITYAALFNPLGVTAQGDTIGTGNVGQPEFKSTICPTHHYSHVGAGFALRYHFCDDKQGFWGSLSTSVENVKSQIKLNEDVSTDKGTLPTTDCTNGTAADRICPNANLSTPGQVTGAIVATAAPVATIAPVASTDIYPVTGFDVHGSTAPANMEEAFVQDAWKYGKIGCERSITRLADIELALGYQWLCSDCAAANWYVGLVIPTGNKPCAEWVADAVVGNGQHAGIMTGSSMELMLSDKDDRQCWYRMDSNARYLFRNTQKRSFDLKNNEWSRYMMVWENVDAYTAAMASLNVAGGAALPNGGEDVTALRAFTPGINVFTHDMKVKPRFIGRLNQAVYMKSDCFRAELGWNVLARTKECVEFSCPWDKKPAFAGTSYEAGAGLNNHRTIFNDSQTTEVVPAIGSPFFSDPPDRVFDAGSYIDKVGDFAAAIADADITATYDKFAITEADVNLDSAASPAALVHTPYLTLGYAWDSDCKPAVSVGASYEFSAGNNRAISNWLVWGKFELAF